MAQFAPRVYRDYSLDDEDSWALHQDLPRKTSSRTSTRRSASDRADTPQTVVLGDYPSPVKEKFTGTVEEIPTSRIEYHARTPENDAVKERVNMHPGYGVARIVEESYIDDSSSNTSDGEPVEPTLNAAQVDPPKANGHTSGTMTALPPNVPTKRQNPGPRSPKPERSVPQRVQSSTESARVAAASEDMMNSKMPEFFSMSVFQAALYNPTISHQLLKFGQSRLCGENMDFLARVHKYQGLITEVSRTIVEMHDEFVAPTAPNQINVPEQVRVKTTYDAKASLNSTVPLLENLFVRAQTDIENLVYSDVYPKFVRHQMTLSAARALGANRSQYAGLGDCFVLTDPNKADNPIIYASDGFVSVTGYQRNEIIPRNCRFLQGKHTHQTSVRRLRKKIDKQEESVELLLNYKKNGEPFWNLLYTTPLFDSNGKLIFFMGGQINCSTTVHSTSDVMRILAQSKDTSDTESTKIELPRTNKQPRARRIMSMFRTNSSSNFHQQAPGMEGDLLNKIEDMPLKSQMDTFYTAYSNYVLINYTSFLITFISTGLLDLLFPIKAAKAANSSNPAAAANSTTHPSPAAAVGTDIFKFLANHSDKGGSVSWDFRSTVKAGLKQGNPVSVDMKLCARPYMGFERFVLHWTPLKDEKGNVQWVMLTLGNEKRA